MSPPRPSRASSGCQRIAGSAYRIPIRLSDDEYTRAHAAARTAGQNLETWIHDRITELHPDP
ncbi:hypothetical protein ACNJ7E_38090 [Rhodococcus sp. NM-2]|uniref:hypothetical protein n=1 Tax=Rhodococcus TaxID=1827 RepID=UPI0009340F98|nr:hypothetical protein [Rhodococcus koreensis]